MTMRVLEPATSNAPAPRKAAWFRLYSIAFFCLFVTHLDVYLATRGLISFNIIVLLVGMIGLFAAMLLLAGRFPDFLDDLVDGILQNLLPLSFFILWMAGHILFIGEAHFHSTNIDFGQLFPIYQLIVLIFGLGLARLPESRTDLSFAGKLAILLLGGSVLYDAIYPGAFSVLANRGAGFAQDANIAAFIMNCVLAVSLNYKKYRIGDVLIFVFAVFAVFFTFSRAGIAQFLFVAIVYVFAPVFTNLRAASKPPILGLLVTFVALLLIGAHLGQIVDATAIHNVKGADERLEQLLFRGKSLTDDPYRLPLFEYYLGLINERPFFGFGTGYSLMAASANAPYQVGPHMMFLRVWIDNGLWGLITYSGLLLSLLGLMVRRRSVGGALLAVLLIMNSFFSHTMIDEKSCLVLIGIALGMTARRIGSRETAGAYA